MRAIFWVWLVGCGASHAPIEGSADGGPDALEDAGRDAGNACPGAPSDEWSSVEVVDAEGDTGHGASMAVRGSEVHVAYCDERGLRHALRTGTWAAETVDGAGCGSTSIAALSDGTIQVAYDIPGEPGWSPPRTGEVRLATFDGATWQTEVVDEPAAATPTGAFGPSLLVVDGVPHVAYGGAELRHAWKSARRWEIETVTADFAPFETSLAGDAAGLLDVACAWEFTGKDLFGTALSHATNRGGAWSVETISANTYDPPHAKMIVPVDSVPQIGGFDWGRLRVWRSDADWASTEVESDVRPGSAFVDQGGLLEAVWVGAGDVLRSGWDTGKGWTGKTIVEEGIAEGPTAAMDERFDLHLAWREAGAGDLLYLARAADDVDVDCDGSNR